MIQYIHSIDLKKVKVFLLEPDVQMFDYKEMQGAN